MLAPLLGEFEDALSSAAPEAAKELRHSERSASSVTTEVRRATGVEASDDAVAWWSRYDGSGFHLFPSWEFLGLDLSLRLYAFQMEIAAGYATAADLPDGASLAWPRPWLPAFSLSYGGLVILDSTPGVAPSPLRVAFNDAIGAPGYGRVIIPSLAELLKRAIRWYESGAGTFDAEHLRWSVQTDRFDQDLERFLLPRAI
jgi:hypothetical protein